MEVFWNNFFNLGCPTKKTYAVIYSNRKKIVHYSLGSCLRLSFFLDNLTLLRLANASTLTVPNMTSYQHDMAFQFRDLMFRWQP